MKLLGVGDIHGREHWKKIHCENFDRIIFVGDFADSHTIPAGQVLDNLADIIELKKSHPGKIILLLGNHDIQYIEYPRYPCTGFNAELQPAYTRLFREHAGIFQVAWQHGNFLFTHAGLSNGFVRENLAEYREGILTGEINVADLLNTLHNSDGQDRLHSVSVMRGGFDHYGGITWADYRETSGDILPGYHQVVGHTPRKQIETVGDDLGSITYIDVLEAGGGFFEVDL